MNTQVLLSSAYLASIQYYTKLISYDKILIERFETYPKQTYRNRCIILATNGPMILSVPVLGGPGAKGKTGEIQLSYDHNWQHMHWQSILSAYKNSPFFDFYADDLSKFYHSKKWKYLIDFNSDIQNTILEILKIKASIAYTQSWLKPDEIPDGTHDFRYSIHPKTQKQVPDPDFTPLNYTQVFQDKFPFYPNLSIVDLLMNEGPETVNVLRASISKFPL